MFRSTVWMERMSGAPNASGRKLVQGLVEPRKIDD